MNEQVPDTLSIANGGTGPTYRRNNLEYAMDRKDREIKDLQLKIIEMEEEYSVHATNVIIAEILLFLIGVFMGALMMNYMGYRL